jgi:predicted  nucleic acid-binding Zn-ribbon protein
MTQACCPSCGLRFTGAAAVCLTACPECGGPPQSVPSAEHVLGFRLWADAVHSDLPAAAVAVATAIHDPGAKTTR